MGIALDRRDARILEELQKDAGRSIQEIADLVGLSQNACWRRIRALEAAGVIKARVALVDPEKIGLGVTVFVAVKTAEHDQAWLDKFARGVALIPEVVEFYRMSGEVDYLLKIVVPDIRAYDDVYKRLVRVAKLFDVSSSFAMEQIKYTTALPVAPTS